MPRVLLGVWPTPIEPLPSLSKGGSEVWVKRDDLSSPLYGGNKVRKLEPLLTDALDRGARRVVTFGAAGSHHVLATTVHARSLGLDVAAVLVPQPRSDHAAQNLRCALAAGLQPFPVSASWRAPAALARILRPHDYVIPPGGSSVTGAIGYIAAAHEIAAQVRARALPEPDLIVAALGSGGTVAGLLAGVMATGLRSRVVGVQVVDRTVPARTLTLALALGACLRAGIETDLWSLSERLETVRKWIGPGYAQPAPWCEAATARGKNAGLQLESTYTAKAFADVLERADLGRGRVILYVHTLSAVRPKKEASLSSALDELFTEARR